MLKRKRRRNRMSRHRQRGNKQPAPQQTANLLGAPAAGFASQRSATARSSDHKLVCKRKLPIFSGPSNLKGGPLLSENTCISANICKIYLIDAISDQLSRQQASDEETADRAPYTGIAWGKARSRRQKISRAASTASL